MKKRLLALFLTLAALLCVPAAAWEQEDLVLGSGTDIAMLDFIGNAGGNYIRGNGSAHSPGKSFLFNNEKGGVTLVQYTGKTTGVAVAEFDSELNFQKWYKLSAKNPDDWAGFCAGKKYNYVIFGDDLWVTGDCLRIDQYTKDWEFVRSTRIPLNNTRGLVGNDFDVVESNGVLHIITNRTMTEGTANGHQANVHVEIDSETLAPVLEHSGVANYTGYCSHSFVPDIVASGNKLYTFDRSDSVPGAGLYMTTFQGSLASGSMSGIKSMAFADFGSLGNAIAAPGESALAAYNYGAYTLNSVPDNCNVYLYHSASGTKQVNYNGGAGTPMLAPMTDQTGFVLWNPDPWSDEEGDNLYFAPYVVTSSSLSVGAVRMEEGHYLSDCEPIPFNDGILWFTSGNRLTFHHMDASGNITDTVIHSPEVRAGTPSTCSEPGKSDEIYCKLCYEVLQVATDLPLSPHTPTDVAELLPTCAAEGHTAGTGCADCGAVLTGQEPIEKLPHTETTIPGTPATCTQTGLTDGKWCSVCESMSVEQEVIPMAEHTVVDTPAVSPFYGIPGQTAGTKCSACEVQLSGGEEIPGWRFHFHQISTYQYGDDGPEFIINITNEGDVPFWYVVNLYDNDGKHMKLLMFAGDTGDNWCRFPYIRGVGKVEAFALSADLRPMADEKFVKTYANYVGP